MDYRRPPFPFYAIERSGRISRAQAFHAEGRAFDSWSIQTNAVYNLYLLLPSPVLNINKI